MSDVMRQLGRLAFCVLFAAAGAAAEAGDRVKLAKWSKIESERYGFLIAYPGSVFTPRDGVPAEDGQVLISRDGAARLLVAAFENDANASLMEYRDQILAENYQGADLDYAPIKKRSFIVSGTQGTMHFYERVSFTCGGKLINSWALLYPVSERPFYDRVVEAIARTYTPGAGRTGECD